MDQHKKLSICIVALNEEKYLPNLLTNVEQQEYPHYLIEVVLVDGGSSDKTKQIMMEFASQDNGFYNTQVLDNPKRIQAAGWNVAIKHATGDVIARIDAHTMLPAEFSRLVMRDISQGEDVVGGIRPCIIENNTAWSRTLLAVENALFGSSINVSRRSGKKRNVKTMFHASYRREVFEKVGLFNEKLLRTEDNEMHYRIREKGFKLFFDPEIVSYQYARNSLLRMIKQKYGNGYWIGLTLGVCPKCISIYHFVPAVFVLGILLTSILAIFGLWFFFALMWGMYVFFCVISMLWCFIKGERKLLFVAMPFLFLCLHVSYGIGTIIGLAGIARFRKTIHEF